MDYSVNRLTPLRGGQTPGAGKNLLPLTKGNVWQMKHTDWPEPYRLEVVGPTRKKGASGIEVRISRGENPNGHEIYRREGGKMLLVAFSEFSDYVAGLVGPVTLTPALPLWAEPASVGATLNWKGAVDIDGDRKTATATSRVVRAERIVTATGPVTAYRIETTITLTKRGDDTRFRRLLWLAPGVGFVQRSTTSLGFGPDQPKEEYATLQSRRVR